MNKNNPSLFTKTKQLFSLSNNIYPENNIITNNYPSISSINTDQNQKNDNFYNNKTQLKMNNERISNLNKLIKERKEKIENILTPIRYDIKREEIDHNDYQINNTMCQLNKIKTAYNINCLQINNEFIQLKNKRNKLILVYNSLYNFKQKLLNKEKDLKLKEQKINKRENEIKIKEEIIKNKYGSFNNYINYEKENLMNKYKNLKNYHQQREDELIQREEKIQEYENIIKNIIKTREYQNKEKIKECMDLSNNLEKNIENEKEKQLIKDIEIIEKEKENIEKEKELLKYEKEQIQNEKKENIKFKKINQNKTKKLQKKQNKINKTLINMNYRFPDFDKNINNTFNSQIEEEHFNNSFFGKMYKNNKNINMKKLVTPIGLSYNSARYKFSNQNILNNSKNNTKENSFFLDSIYKNNCSSIRINEDSYSQNYKINNSYVHDNIYLTKYKSNSNSKISKNGIPIPSSTSSSRKNRNIIKIDNENSNIVTNRTMNLEHKNKLILNTTNESIITGKEDDTKSKYLEIKSDFNKTFNDINSKIFEAEKALQKIQNQERKIKIIKDKLDKKAKNQS